MKAVLQRVSEARVVVDVRVEQLPANWATGQRAEVYIQTGAVKP